VLALRRVLSTLRQLAPPFSGEMIAIAGNRQALRVGRRFLDRDLNRGWTPRGMEKAETNGASDGEDREQGELILALRTALAGESEGIRVIDLHTTSADSIPFLTLGDTLRNREFARRIGLPLVLGIEEQIDGALLEVITERGSVTLGIEAGQHDDPASVDHHERAIWMALFAGGHVDPTYIPGARRMREDLRHARGGLPMVFEVRYRRPVEQGDGFRMRPNYVNFQRIVGGEEVARDGRGPVLAPEGGRIFLPLYQDQGDDGFFVVRDVHPAWLRVSSLLRRAHVEALMRWLPGIHQARRRPDALIVDRRVARWLTLQVFHLLGYRKTRVTRGWYVFRRRSHDGPVKARRQAR
jgi:succinylglutamate desuccinylase